MDKTQITIIGSGVCGLALSYALSKKYSDILVVERHDAFGRETSSRNSEVIHAGIYYPKDSLKAQLCARGKELLYEVCQKHNIPHQKIGKILVACNEKDSLTLSAIQQNALENQVCNLRFLNSRELATMAPTIRAHQALLSPDTGILDSHQLMNFLYLQSKNNGVTFAFNTTITEIQKTSSGYHVTVEESSKEIFSFQTEIVINAAGLSADKIAQLVGIDIKQNKYKIYYNKGQYFRIANPKKFSIKQLIYPTPNATDLGIHITPDLAGGLRLGPDARYISDIDYQINPEDKKIFWASVNRFLASLKIDDLVEDTAGIRAKLQSPSEHFRDFVIKEESSLGFKNFINLIGIESPGLTSCLAIAEKVKTFL